MKPPVYLRGRQVGLGLRHGPRLENRHPGQGLDSGSDLAGCTSNYRSMPQQTARFRRVLTHGRRTDLVRDDRCWGFPGTLFGAAVAVVFVAVCAYALEHLAGRL